MYLDKLWFNRVRLPCSEPSLRTRQQGDEEGSCWTITAGPHNLAAVQAFLSLATAGAYTEMEDPLDSVEPMNPFSLGSIYKSWFIFNMLFPYQFWLLVGLNKGHLCHFFLKVESALNSK
ncbi:hypothetical protein ACRRTK_019721 [Alexandromys fortis]